MKKHTLKSLMDEHKAHQNTAPMTQKRVQKIVVNSDDTEILEEEAGYVLFRLNETFGLLSNHFFL